MSKGSIGLGALLAVASLGATAATQKSAAKSGGAVERGKYLVMTSACNDCHTPKKMGPNGPELDMSRMLAGHVAVKMPPPPASSGPWIIHANDQLTAWSGPWGISYTKNLTPDQNTGIGSWSEETFIKAIRTGKHMGVSRPILPPMPWEVYRQMTDADLKAIYAYLRTIPAISNPTPDPVPPPAAPAPKPAGKKS
jgi:mono/diheme cytochrome c family protein